MSVPAQGVAPAGTPSDAVGSWSSSPPPATGHADAPAATGGASTESEPGACAGTPGPGSARRSGIPSLSAASWSHSGGLNRNDV
ncbi:hypothetical protein K351_04883 [Streptomyces sp. DpondAA-E10]|nr:hypothetical protein K351_04883 [Streptomyces sp. DpondAA-E10]